MSISVEFEPLPERLAFRSSGRSILAELIVNGDRVVVGSFHATPGSGKVGGVEVGEWKPFFHGAVALELAEIDDPFVFAIDANEPLTETVDGVTFHWREGRSGVEKLKALLGLEPIHRGRDLFREWLKSAGGTPASEDLLLATYAPSATFQRRFDSIWATPEFETTAFTTHADEVFAAGGDHAMLVADRKAAFRPAWGALMAEVSGYDRARRARAMGYMSAGEDAGEMAGPILAGFLWSTWGAPVLFAVRIGWALAAEIYTTAISGALYRGHRGDSPTRRPSRVGMSEKAGG